MYPHIVSLAAKNLDWLSTNEYPGRGLILGCNAAGTHLVQIYWIMGRSENSRNRVFGSKGGRLFTEAADPSKMKDPSLIIYNAMLEREGAFLVSNGDQTDTAMAHLIGGDAFAIALRDREYEPDAPNYTPRITGLCSLNGQHPEASISILRKSPWGSGCDRINFSYETLEPGYGHCVTTYMDDGNPLPSFTGEPLLMPLGKEQQEVLETYWNALDGENLVSLAVKFINRDSGKSEILIENNYKKVG